MRRYTPTVAGRLSCCSRLLMEQHGQDSTEDPSTDLPRTLDYSLQVGLPDGDSYVVLCGKPEELFDSIYIVLTADRFHLVVDPVHPLGFIEGKQLMHLLPG